MHDKIAQLQEILTVIESNHRSFFAGVCQECGSKPPMHAEGCGFATAFELLDTIALACPPTIAWRKERNPNTGEMEYIPELKQGLPGSGSISARKAPLVYPPLRPEMSISCPKCKIALSLNPDDFKNCPDADYNCPDCEVDFTVSIDSVNWLRLLNVFKLEDDAAMINSKLLFLYDSLEGCQS
jgi:hypothetical protein